MSDNERGAYTPQSDAPLAFDARRMGGAGRRPMPITLIISALILVVVVVGAVLLYKNGARSPEEPPMPVGEPVGPVRTAPDAQDQVQQPPGLQVYQSDAPPAGAAPNFTPPPEQPVRPPPVEAAPLPPPPAAPQTAAPLPPAPASQPVAPAPKPAQPAAKAPAPQAAAPQPAAPKTAPAPQAAAPKASAAPSAPAPSAASAARVQIGAFSSTALADAGWNKVARLLPGQMVGKTKVVEKVERDGKTLYRSLIGGFASRVEAEQLCDALRAQGEACAVR